MDSKTDWKLFGHCRIQYLGTTSDVEVGWWLAKQQWGRGFATEAGRGAVPFALDELKLDRVLAIAHLENRSSHRVMERLRMRFQRQRKGRELGLPRAEAEMVFYHILRQAFVRGNADQSGSSAE